VDTPGLAPPFELEARLRRSRGRTGRTFVASTKVTASEQNELIRAATSEGKAFSEWARDVLLREARRADADALFTEVIATRMLLVNLIKPLVEGGTIPKNYVADAMAEIRRVKHKAAKDVRQQYNDEDKGGR
jgi:phage I-like protein